MVWQAYIHRVPTSGHLHLRVIQSSFDEHLRAEMRYVGSPAVWNQAHSHWDYPLTPAAIIQLNLIADQFGETIQYSDDLKEFAEGQLAWNKYEEEVRLSIQTFIDNEDAALPEYFSLEPVDPTTGKAMPPMRHQKISYHWLLRSAGLLLWHEPGLGKTRSAVDGLAGWYRTGQINPMTQHWWPGDEHHKGRWVTKGGVLVVCPKPVMRTWSRELTKWQNASGIEVSHYKASRKIELSGMRAHAHIINYESLNHVMFNEYDAIIADESHRLANNSGQTSNVQQLSLKAKKVVLLSGTPISNSLESIFYQALIIDGGKTFGSSKTKFREKYFEREDTFDSNPQHAKWVPKEGAVETVSELMGKFTYFLKKSEVLDLPPKTHSPIYLEMTKEQKKYYNSLKKEAITYIQDAEVTIDLASARMMKLLQVCQGFVLADDGMGRAFSNAKMDAFCEKLTTDWWGKKIIVWTHFKYETQTLCNYLDHYQKQYGLRYIRMDGSIKSQKKRDDALDLWNTDPGVTVFVRQISMSEGVTMHAVESGMPCYTSVYLGLTYSYVHWKQSQDRVHRIGQTMGCDYTYFLTENGVDRGIYENLLLKEETAELAFHSGKEFYMDLLKNSDKEHVLVA